MAQRDLLKEGIPGNKKILIGSAIIGMVLIIALFAPLIAPHDPSDRSEKQDRSLDA